mmetsp:Transcript_12093/g.25412  ORF Transcript_12093/g.25412 Transcript_12093/m.25412 type:complete len:216 (+) Transcript_12093:1692-2339(+)
MHAFLRSYPAYFRSLFCASKQLTQVILLIVPPFSESPSHPPVAPVSTARPFPSATWKGLLLNRVTCTISSGSGLSRADPLSPSRYCWTVVFAPISYQSTSFVPVGPPCNLSRWQAPPWAPCLLTLRKNCSALRQWVSCFLRLLLNTRKNRAPFKKGACRGVIAEVLKDTCSLLHSFRLKYYCWYSQSDFPQGFIAEHPELPKGSRQFHRNRLVHL